MTDADPKYSEQESALILQRAAEMSAQQGRSLSLTELQSAAAEAGIDAALVRRAAGEVATLGTAPPPAPSPASGALGAPLRVLEERMGPGVLPPSRVEDVRLEIERHLGLGGRLESTERQLTWHPPEGRVIHVSLTLRDGRTLVRVEERLGGLAGGLFLGMGLPLTFGGLGFILPICIVALDMPWLIPVAFAVWAALVFGLARTIYASTARQRAASLRALADGLADLCRPSLPPAGDP